MCLLPGSTSSLPLRVLCPQRTLTLLSQSHTLATFATRQSGRGTPLESLRSLRPFRKQLAEGTAPGKDATVKPAPGVARGASEVLVLGMELANAKMGPAEPSRERRSPGPRRQPERLGDGTAGTRKRLGRTGPAAATAAVASGAALQGWRGTRRAPQPGAPGRAEPPPPVRAAGRAARKVSLVRSWVAAGTGRPVASALAGAAPGGCSGRAVDTKSV